jgi:hypothetical protein
VTHAYPHNPMLDSVTISRVTGLADLGFTGRQREFLVTVLVHSGCFLERQYCAFTGTARGQNSREFVARLAARGLARAIEPGPVRRGRLYHVHHKPLYEAIGQPDNRNRRLHSIGRMVERVMLLDAVLSDRRCWWLSSETDKRTFFDVAQETGLGPEEYPHITFRSGSLKTVRCFPDKLPIGIEKGDTSRFVFLYLVNRRIPVDFRQFLIRHHNLRSTCTGGRFVCLSRGASRSPWRSTRPRSERSSGPRCIRASARRWRRTFASGRSRADTSETRPIATSHRSSGNKEWRRSRPSIERGDGRATSCCGGRHRRAFATTACMAAQPATSTC